jgi:tetratricopeptide (TPR) repeat protein
MKKLGLMVTGVLLMAGAAAASVAPDLGVPETVKGSFWYVLDHVVDVQPDAVVNLIAVIPGDHARQKVKLGNIYPTPDRIVTDPDHGNRIVVWKHHPEPGPEQVYFRIDFSAEVSAWTTDVDPAEVRDPDRGSALYRLYTHPEPWIETGGKVADKAAEIVGEETNPYLQARLLFDWMVRNLRFVPGGGSDLGALGTLDAESGDCGQYSRLFAGFCRSLGIPARSVTNVWLDGGLHRYAEFHVEPYGWIPVDVSVAQAMMPEHSLFDDMEIRVLRLTRGIPSEDPTWLFGNLYRNHVTLTVGNNIVMPAPEGRTPLSFMVLEPGGAEAHPEAISLKGLNADVVHGGFFVFDRLIDTEEAHQLAHQKLADQFFDVGMDEFVEEGCLMATEEHVDGVTTWINLGRVYLHKKSLARAEACFLRALDEIAPNRSEKLDAALWAHNYLGNCYDLMEKRDMALAEYRKVIELNINYKGAVDYARRYLLDPYAP